MKVKARISQLDAPHREQALGWDLQTGSTPAFSSPWEARAFAMVVRLSESGCFTWTEWVDCLSAHIRAAGDAARQGERNRSDAEIWVDAAEALLIEKGVTSAEQLRARRLASWPLDSAHGRTSTAEKAFEPTSIC